MPREEETLVIAELDPDSRDGPVATELSLDHPPASAAEIVSLFALVVIVLVIAVGFILLMTNSMSTSRRHASTEFDAWLVELGKGALVSTAEAAQPLTTGVILRMKEVADATEEAAARAVLTPEMFNAPRQQPPGTALVLPPDPPALHVPAEPSDDEPPPTPHTTSFYTSTIMDTLSTCHETYTGRIEGQDHTVFTACQDDAIIRCQNTSNYTYDLSTCVAIN